MAMPAAQLRATAIQPTCIFAVVLNTRYLLCPKCRAAAAALAGQRNHFRTGFPDKFGEFDRRERLNTPRAAAGQGQFVMKLRRAQEPAEIADRKGKMTNDQIPMTKLVIGQ
jgi:hypothetical protein